MKCGCGADMKLKANFAHGMPQAILPDTIRHECTDCKRVVFKSNDAPIARGGGKEGCMKNNETQDAAGNSEPACSSVKYRLTALYHNCKSAAAFAMHDAAIENDDVMWKMRRAEANAYDGCAGWLKAMIDDLPNAHGEPEKIREQL